MKNQIALAVIIFAALSCSAQKKISQAEYNKGLTISKSGTIVENPDIDKFEGHWEWVMGARKLDILFTKSQISYEAVDGVLTFQTLSGDYNLYDGNRKVSTTNKNLILEGTTLTDKNIVNFKFPRGDSYVYLNLVYVDKTTLSLKYAPETTADLRKSFPFPGNIVLKRVK